MGHDVIATYKHAYIEVGIIISPIGEVTIIGCKVNKLTHKKKKVFKIVTSWEFIEHLTDAVKIARNAFNRPDNNLVYFKVKNGLMTLKTRIHKGTTIKPRIPVDDIKSFGKFKLTFSELRRIYKKLLELKKDITIN